MKLITKGFLCLMICLFISNAAQAQQPTAYKAKLKTMFLVSGSEASYKTVIEQMFGMYKQQYPSVPDSVWNEFRGEFLKTSMDDLVEMLEPVYSKHLNQDDLQAIIAFYETPAGKKFAGKTPVILQESMQAGQQWGVKIGQAFAEKLKRRGY